MRGSYRPAGGPARPGRRTTGRAQPRRKETAVPLRSWLSPAAPCGGGAYRLEMLPTTCHVYFGEACLASADGRGERQPVSGGISPVQDADRHGPPATTRSSTWSRPTSCARPRPTRHRTATSSSAWRATATTSAIYPRRSRTRSSGGRSTRNSEGGRREGLRQTADRPGPHLESRTPRFSPTAGSIAGGFCSPSADCPFTVIANGLSNTPTLPLAYNAL